MRLDRRDDLRRRNIRRPETKGSVLTVHVAEVSLAIFEAMETGVMMVTSAAATAMVVAMAMVLVIRVLVAMAMVLVIAVLVLMAMVLGIAMAPATTSAAAATAMARVWTSALEPGRTDATPTIAQRPANAGSGAK